jgi:hypothetical protein
MGASGSPGSAGVPTAVGGSPMVVVGGSVVAPAGAVGVPMVPGAANVAPGGNAGGTTASEVATANTVAPAGAAMPSAHRRSATDNRRVSFTLITDSGLTQVKPRRAT